MDNGHDHNAPQPSDTGATPQSAASQGIFSSPDLSVNSENLEEIKPELSDENKSRIASAFAKTDATQQHDQLNEQMAEQDAISGDIIPAANSTTSTATGDIKIPGAKKKSKAPLIVLALIVLAAVGGLVAWLVLGQTSNNPSQPTTALSATETDFAKYANYLLYGEEKTTFDGEYDANRSYTLNQQLGAENYDQGYWDKTSELLDKTAETLAQADDPAKDQLVNALNTYRQNFNFVKYYKSIGDLDEEALLGTFLTSGMEGVTTALNNFYARLSLLGSEVATAYVAQRTQQYTDMMNVYNIYSELGCVQDGKVNEEVCTAFPSAEQQDQLIKLTESSNRAARSANSTLQNAVRHVVSYCWGFDSWLKNPTQPDDNAGENVNETTE